MHLICPVTTNTDVDRYLESPVLGDLLGPPLCIHEGGLTALILVRSMNPCGSKRHAGVRVDSIGVMAAVAVLLGLDLDVAPPWLPVLVRHRSLVALAVHLYRE